MIGRISGRLDYRADDHVLIDTGGVGYLVFVSERTLAALPRVGEAVALYTDLVVREDLLQLFGFQSLQEKEWHRLLTSVQGIGAKASLAILGALGPEGVSRAIALGDSAAIKAAPGVGPKLAQRVVNELKDKAARVMAMAPTHAANLSSEQSSSVPVTATAPPTEIVVQPSDNMAQADTISALLNLGYGQAEAATATAQAAAEAPDATTATLIRAALRKLAPKDS